MRGSQASGADGSGWLTNQSIMEHGWPLSEHRRESACEIEVDAYPWDILNRHRVQERRAEPFLRPVPGLSERLQKLVPSLNNIWEVCVAF